jgi:4-hydroxy-tetrahydrodipicolinate synthase
VITPFNDDLSIDFSSFEKILNSLLKANIDFIVPLGTTGETPTLSENEQIDVLQFVNDKIAGKIPIVSGHAAGNNTVEVIRKIKECPIQHLAAHMISCPAYNKPNQEGLFQHFSAIANATNQSILLYNVPSRSGVNLSADTTIRIHKNCPNVIGIKEASADMEQIQKIIANTTDDFIVLSGDDPTAVAQTLNGGDGLISVLGNAYPKEYTEIIRAALNGEEDQARLLDKKFDPFHHWLYCEGNPTGIKALMSHLGFCKNILRLPLVPLSSESQDALLSLVEG